MTTADKSTAITAWAVYRTLRMLHGARAVSDQLYSWFSADHRTCSHWDAGIHLLLTLDEPDALLVLHHCHKMITKVDGYNWQKFVDQHPTIAGQSSRQFSIDLLSRMESHKADRLKTTTI